MRTYLILLLLLFLASCGTDEPSNIEPTLRTLEATGITRTAATLQGSVSLQGSTSMPKLAFAYGLGNDMASTVAAADSANGSISARLYGLNPGTTYRYQLIADNGRVTIHANTMTFATQPNLPPTIDSAAILSSSPVSAIVGFLIPDDGGEKLKDVGCYIVKGNASPGSSLPADARKVPAYGRPTVTGEWRTVITELSVNTAYTIFPYAATIVGETIGKGLTLNTSNAIVVTEGGDFALMMKGQHADSVSVAGSLNGDDILCLKSLNPISIDMGGARIISGGAPYSETSYTENDIVGYHFFTGCTRLSGIVLPAGAVKISKDAFKNCTSLKEISIPASATEVTPSAGCTSLATIKVSEANTGFKSVDGVLTDASVVAIVWFPMGKKGSYTMPATITSVGDFAFSQCSIATFTMGENITRMGQSVFYNSGVENVTLPGKLQTVPTATFQHCAKLRTVSIGQGTELISSRVFDGCPLTDLYVNAIEPPACAADAFATTGNDFTKTCTLHVPEGSAKYYKASNAWKAFARIVEDRQ